MAEIEAGRALAHSLVLTPKQAQAAMLHVNQDGQRRDAIQLLAYPSIGFEDLCRVWPELAGLSEPVREQLEIEALYAGYLDRQEADIAAFRKDEDLQLPLDLDFGAIGGLSNEMREKLSLARPATLGQAGRIEGVTPGALSALVAHLKKAKRAAG
jgi:tRNA uridine 5-carboxymethylaminomethyl modification enzyme